MSFADIQFPRADEIVMGRILEKGDGFYNMNLMCLSESDDLYRFEEEDTHVQIEYVMNTFDDPSESDLGLTQFDDNSWMKTDPDYVPSDEDESEDESLVDEEED